MNIDLNQIGNGALSSRFNREMEKSSQEHERPEYSL